MDAGPPKLHWQSEKQTVDKEGMMRLLCVALLSSAVVLGAENPAAQFVQPEDKIFPHIVSGGVWVTDIYLVNMTANSMAFSMQFFDDFGAALPLPFVLQDGTLGRGSQITFTMPPNTNFTLETAAVDASTSVGWARLTYDSSLGRIGGFLVFRQLVPGRLAYEASVPLANSQDYRFYLPFNNTGGFTTGIALANGGSSTTQVLLQFLNRLGAVVFSDTITLPPGNHTAFALSARYPALAGQIGTLYVQGSALFLSGLGLRFADAGPFTTLPVLNWSGMFP